MTVTMLSPDVVVHAVRDMPVLPEPVEQAVERLWREARDGDPRLFNGVVFSADRITGERIEGHWTEFRRALAQMREPALTAALDLRPLAVVGLLHCADGIVLGRREASAVYQAGLWQSVPAGSVERRATDREGGDGTIDLVAQLLAECDEELGLGPAELRVGRKILAFEHEASRVVDVGISLSTGLDFATVERCWRQRGNQEYDRLALAGEKLAVLPSTQALLVAGDHVV